MKFALSRRACVALCSVRSLATIFLNCVLYFCIGNSFSQTALSLSLSHSLTPVQRRAGDLRDLDRETPRECRAARHRRQHHGGVVVEPHVDVHCVKDEDHFILVLRGRELNCQPREDKEDRL